ncbi:uncharacterized protein LOC131663435 [Phymastichus coffea]|uniref:uncharacterized protein LOC131663435 n=1 Tax=Phymastichus coffea TaxID=108790 RepID=UPI00273CE5EF|nr:uncharacterized protein LOC131663435 [Phymastichus coffea]
MTMSGEVSVTSTLLPSVTRVVEASRAPLELGPVAVVLAGIIVLVLSLLTVGCNSIILAAFYKYKRLRTASNYLLVSLAVSDFSVGVFMPFGTYLELANRSEATNTRPVAAIAGFCVLPYCALIALCSVSVLVTVAIAADRTTSLAQPLRYKNIITHSSIEKYIVSFWIYAIAVGLSPLVYARFSDTSQTYSGSCRFSGVIMPPMRVILFAMVWAPSAFILLGCYMYVYFVARAHARAIYTVELSFRNQTQTMALPRYGQTLAVTVGAFFILWLPFQTCMLLDFFCGTNIISDCTIWLGLPILAHSGANPWIYAFHHGEIRIAAGKIAEDIVSRFGVTPSRYGCSPARRGSNTNLELAEVNNSLEERRPPVEDCFAARQHQSIVYASRRCLEMSSKNLDISPEKMDRASSSESIRHSDVIEENIHDLTKMLDPKYIVYRNHMIDSNHNIDKIKNLKYLLDPTFSKIRHLRRLNHRKTVGKNGSRFVSYQNLKIDCVATVARKGSMHLNTMSDPQLNADTPDNESRKFIDCQQTYERKSTTLASVSDSNIKNKIVESEMNMRFIPTSRTSADDHRYSVHNLDTRYVKSYAQHHQRVENHRRSFSWARARQRFNNRFADSPSPSLELRFQQTSYASLPTPDGTRSSLKSSPKLRSSTKQLTITPNRLASLFNHEQPSAMRPIKTESIVQAKWNLDLLNHSESINTLPATYHTRLLEPSRLMDTLIVPTIHSEPPSPIDPLPLDSLKEEECSNHNPTTPVRTQPFERNLKSPVRYSDPVIPSVLLNIEDYSQRQENGVVNPQELSDLLSRCGLRERLTDSIFPEHDSTRFSSRRPSDSKWSESSRSQEILSNVMEHPRFPSSYSVNNFQTCTNTSGSDLNDLTSCLEPFMCSDALSSSLRESFFSAPDSENIFTSFEADEPEQIIPVPKNRCSSSSANLVGRPAAFQREVQLELQSKSTESMFRTREQNERLCAILRLEPTIHRSRPQVRPVICKDSRLAPLATPTPTEVCTPTFDITVVADIKTETGLGVRV